MPVLLRLAIAALGVVVLFAGAAVLAFDGAPTGATVVGSLALGFLVVPPMLAGSFISFWIWDPSARRRLRVWLIVLGAVQATAAIGFAAVTAALPSGTMLAVGVLAAALALDPLSVLLGRAARRREQAAPPRDDPDEILAAVRRAWRRAGIGALIGTACGIVLWTVLTAVLDDRPSVDPQLVVLLIAPVSIGAGIGILTVTVTNAGRIRDLLGGDFASARRIGRAITGRPVDLTDDETSRASRYAQVAPAWIRLQQAQQLLTSSVSLVVLLGIVLNGHDAFRWVIAALVSVSAALVVLAVILFQVQIRRVRRFAATHPAVGER